MCTTPKINVLCCSEFCSNYHSSYYWCTYVYMKMLSAHTSITDGIRFLPEIWCRMSEYHHKHAPSEHNNHKPSLEHQHPLISTNPAINIQIFIDIKISSHYWARLIEKSGKLPVQIYQVEQRYWLYKAWQ